jgi:hypothetical protein
MRKHLITAAPQAAPRIERDWLDLGSVATVEVTSETKDHPVEGRPEFEDVPDSLVYDFCASVK